MKYEITSAEIDQARTTYENFIGGGFDAMAKTLSDFLVNRLLPEPQPPLGGLTGEEYAEINQGRRGPPHPTFGELEELIKLRGWYDEIVAALGDDLVLKRIGNMQQQISKLSIYKQDLNIEYRKLERWYQEAQKDIKRLENRPAPLPTLRPIAEMSEKVPEGCVRVLTNLHHDGSIDYLSVFKPFLSVSPGTLACDILLPAASAEDKWRAEFEKALQERYPSNMERKDDGYDNHVVQVAWHAWKAAKSTPETK